MSAEILRKRLSESSLGGRYEMFLGVGGGLALLGAVLFIRALTGDDAHRAWHVFHSSWLYFTGLCGGSIAFAAVHKTVNAKWSGVMMRFAEAAVAFAPISLLGFVLIFTLGYDAVYGHMQHELHGLSAGKQLWLSRGFMTARMGIGLLVLYWVGWRLIKTDMIPDVAAAKPYATGGRRSLYERWTANFDGSEGALERIERSLRHLGPTYCVLYALVFTIVAFDGIMALQPHWFSNLLGGWYFMGAFLGAHMLLALTSNYGARQLEIEDLVSAKQRHDLGKLAFGFSIFWTYLFWAQFQVIWYANLPEETGFVYSRVYGAWVPIAKAVITGMFFIPFIGLLGVVPKKTRWWMGLIATVSLVALWLERYIMVLPSVSELPGPVFGAPELGAVALLGGLFLLTNGLFARTFPMVSPRLSQITLDREVHHHEVEVYDHEDTDKDFVHEQDLDRPRPQH